MAPTLGSLFLMKIFVWDMLRCRRRNDSDDDDDDDDDKDAVMIVMTTTKIQNDVDNVLSIKPRQDRVHRPGTCVLYAISTMFFFYFLANPME